MNPPHTQALALRRALAAAALLALLGACGVEQRNAPRDALLLDDGRTAVVTYSERRVRTVRASGFPPTGPREETVRHRMLIGRLDLTTGALERLVVLDLRPGADDAAYAQLSWGLGDKVLVHTPVRTGDVTKYDWSLLDARSGIALHLGLASALAERGTPQIADVRLVASDGTIAVHAFGAGEDASVNRPGAVWLRRGDGTFLRLAESGAAERCNARELVYSDGQPAQRFAYRFVDGSRRSVHPRELDAFTLLHEDRPRLLQVRAAQSAGGAATAKPHLALAKKVGGSWVETPVEVDWSKLR